MLVRALSRKTVDRRETGVMRLRARAEAVISNCRGRVRMRPALRGRRVPVVVRVEADERLVSALVTSAALVSASMLCVAGVPPRLGGLSVLGAVMLAAGLIGAGRLLRSS